MNFKLQEHKDSNANSKNIWPFCVHRLRKLAIVKEVEVQLQFFLASSFLSLALESNTLMHFVEKIQVNM